MGLIEAFILSIEALVPYSMRLMDTILQGKYGLDVGVDI